MDGRRTHTAAGSVIFPDMYEVHSRCMPGLLALAKQWMEGVRGERARATAMACSRAPEPTTSTLGTAVFGASDMGDGKARVRRRG